MSITREQLSANFAKVESIIQAACDKVKRKREGVTLVAVSKLHQPELIRMAWELGHRDFGENYAQELRDKRTALADCRGLIWHAIGPVQTRNAKYITRAAHVFHALDRFEVAQELSRRREAPSLRCLIEVNVAGENSKAGIAPEELGAFIESVRVLPLLAIVGLTAMPPLSEDPEASRPHFKHLAALAKQHRLKELSMGTTSDYAVAVEEGATLIRVGTALFGARVTAPGT